MKKIVKKCFWVLAALQAIGICFSGCKNSKGTYKKLFGNYDFSSVQYEPYVYEDYGSNEERKETEDEKLCNDYSLYKRFGEFIYVKAKDHICIADYIPKESRRNYEAVDTVVFPEYIENLPVTYISNKGFSWSPNHQTHHIEKLYIPKTVTSIQDGFFIWMDEGYSYIDSIEIDPENPVYEIETQTVESDDLSLGNLYYSGIYDKVQKKLVGIVPNNSVCGIYKYFYVREGTEIIGRHSVSNSIVNRLILPDSVRKFEFNYLVGNGSHVEIVGGENVEYFPEYKNHDDSNESREDDSEQSNDPDFVHNYKTRGYAVLPDAGYNPIPDSFVVNGIVISNKLGFENGYIYEKGTGEYKTLIEIPEDGVLVLSENIKFFSSNIKYAYQIVEGRGLFDFIKFKKVILPDGLEKFKEDCYGMVLDFEVSPDSKNFKYEDGLLIDKNKMRICAMTKKIETKDFLIFPDGIKEMAWFEDLRKCIFVPDSMVSFPDEMYGIVVYGRPDSLGNKYGAGINYHNWYCDNKTGDDRRALYLVKENIRVRKSSDLNSEVVCVVNNGSILYLIEKQKEETEIDGINGHWIKVAAYKDAFDKDGDRLEPGIFGWVFDGYLKKISD